MVSGLVEGGLDAAGGPVERTGDAFQMGGGGLPADTDYCNAIGIWLANGPPFAPAPPADD